MSAEGEESQGWACVQPLGPRNDACCGASLQGRRAAQHRLILQACPVTLGSGRWIF